jgi:hypothetical protein
MISTVSQSSSLASIPCRVSNTVCKANTVCLSLAIAPLRVLQRLAKKCLILLYEAVLAMSWSIKVVPLKLINVRQKLVSFIMYECQKEDIPLRAFLPALVLLHNCRAEEILV